MADVKGGESTRAPRSPGSDASASAIELPAAEGFSHIAVLLQRLVEQEVAQQVQRALSHDIKPHIDTIELKFNMIDAKLDSLLSAAEGENSYIDDPFPIVERMDDMKDGMEQTDDDEERSYAQHRAEEEQRENEAGPPAAVDDAGDRQQGAEHDRDVPGEGDDAGPTSVARASGSLDERGCKVSWAAEASSADSGDESIRDERKNHASQASDDLQSVQLPEPDQADHQGSEQSERASQVCDDHRTDQLPEDQADLQGCEQSKSSQHPSGGEPGRAASTAQGEPIDGKGPRPSRKQRKRAAKAKMEPATRAAPGGALLCSPAPASTHSKPWLKMEPARWAHVLEVHHRLPDVDDPQFCATLQEILDQGIELHEHSAWLEYNNHCVWLAGHKRFS